MADTYFYVHTVQSPAAPSPATMEGSFLDGLITKTCELMNIPVDQLYDRNKRTRSKFSRWLIWEIMYSKGFTLNDCAGIFGHDHTTVVHGLDNLPMDLKQNEFLSAIYNNVLVTMKVNPDDITKMRQKRELNRLQRTSGSAKIAI